jgi:transketolase
MARQRPEIVVMDADLLSDCGIEAFKAELPERFIECGIAEQHMVSAAGGMARNGILPVVHSFACFLASRANEQIYNNATERTKIIYVGTLPPVPGGPGHCTNRCAHLAIGAVPGLIAFEQRTRSPAGHSLGGGAEPREHLLRFVNAADLPHVMPADYMLQVVAASLKPAPMWR